VADGHPFQGDEQDSVCRRALLLEEAALEGPRALPDATTHEPARRTSPCRLATPSCQIAASFRNALGWTLLNGPHCGDYEREVVHREAPADVVDRVPDAFQKIGQLALRDGAAGCL